MVQHLGPDERRLIEEFDSKGLNPIEIAVEVGRRLDTKSRDPRTVKNYLTKLTRERSVNLEKQQQELIHRGTIRQRIDNLKKKLVFPSPMQLWIPDDPKTGKPVTSVGIPLCGNVIEWELVGNNYYVKLDTEFDLVLEHLQSSRRKAILDGLEKWRRLAGNCVKLSYELRLHIEKEAKERTSLSIVPDTEIEQQQKGLLDGFCRSVYWSIFSSEEVVAEMEELQKLVNDGVATKKNETRPTELLNLYKQVSSRSGLRLINYAGFNLAWLHEYEIESVKGIHKRLIVIYQKLSTTSEVNKLVVELRQITASLHHRLDDFAVLKILPGKCHCCPGQHSR